MNNLLVIYKKGAHQSCGASFSGWSMIRYGTVTLSVVPPGWIWSLRLWSRTSLSRWMPCFFFSSDVTNLILCKQKFVPSHFMHCSPLPNNEGQRLCTAVMVSKKSSCCKAHWILLVFIFNNVTKSLKYICFAYLNFLLFKTCLTGIATVTKGAKFCASSNLFHMLSIIGIK